MEEITVGPRTSDAEFYAALDYEKYPILNASKEAYEKGDVKTAKKLFADVARGIFDAEKFFTLENKVKKPELTASLKGTAERALRHEMWSCGTTLKYEGKVDWFANPTYNQYKEWTWQLSRHSELFELANAYRACGDQRYAEGCAELLDSWIKQAVCPPYTDGGYTTLCWRTIECGIRMGLMWPTIIHTFINNPAFTDELIFDYFKSVYEHSERMLHAFTMGNWLMHELNGVGQNGIFYPIFKDSDRWYETSIEKMEKELREMQVYPDGMQFETSCGYHGVVITHVMEVVAIAYKYGKNVPASMLSVVENMLMMYVKLVQANKKMPHPNDGGGGAIVGVVGKFADYFPDNKVLQWVKSGFTDGNAPEFTSFLLEYAGQAALRRDWSWQSSAYMDVGPFGRAHQHEDKLNITISNAEKPILCEAGTYAYDTSDARKYCLDSRGHNVIRVNGMGQNRRPFYKWDTEMLKVRSDGIITLGDEIDKVSGVYDGQFGDGSVKAIHKRTLMMLKNPKLGLPVYIAVDELSSETENEYEAMWHYDVEDAKLLDGVFVSKDIKQFICGDKGEITLVSGVTEPEMQGWICRSSRQNSEEPIPTVLHKVKGSNVRTVNVFALPTDGVFSVTGAILEGDTLNVSYVDGSTDTVSI